MQKELLPLPGYITVTTTEPDMITYDDDPRVKRAKMPCGHVISRESMTAYCSSLLSQGRSTFPCPGTRCEAEWQFFLVKHVANLSPQQTKEFEKRIADSELDKDKRNQTCPRCQLWCRRQDLDTYWVQCPNCTKLQGGKKFIFCWVCLGEWKAERLYGKACGNPVCLGKDKRIRILASCPEKMVLERKAPSVRGCPKCGTLFEYNDGCVQMNCKSCRHYFCYYCLQLANTKAELDCTPYKSTCIMAPRQAVLPGL